MPTAKICGESLYYEVHGQGPWLAFAHGTSGNHFSWWQQVPYFANHFRCLIFDQPGWGLSRRNGPLNPERFASELAALLRHLGARPAALVGQSMGGWTALGCALQDPGSVSHLILASSLAGLTDDAMLTDLVAAHDPNRPFDERLALAEDFPRRDPERTFLYQQIAALNPKPSLEFLRALVTLRYASKANAVAIPVCFIAGARDQLFPLDLIRQAQAKLKQATLTIVPEAGHSVYFERPEQFNHTIASFLGVKTAP